MGDVCISSVSFSTRSGDDKGLLVLQQVGGGGCLYFFCFFLC